MNSRRCADCRELISAFVDGEISPRERVELRAHLAACPECAALLETYRTIGQRVRTLQPVHSPEYLTDAIFAQTIDAEPRRLLLITSRIGYSMAAVAAVVLIFVVSGYLILGGYERATRPAVASSAPPATYTEPWPLNGEIEITFNKSMNRASVEAALAIQPAGEDERLGRAWAGDTLIIGGNDTLRPDTTYLIKITNDARDAWGNRLEPSFSLSFTTASSVPAHQQTPTPTPELAVIPTTTAAPMQSPTANATADGGNATPSVDRGVVPPTSVASPTPTGLPTGPGGQDNPGSATEAPSNQEEPTPTATATTTPVVEDVPADFPTATPTQPAPATATPSPTPTTAPTSTPTATTTPTPTQNPATSTPTLPPTATATPETIAVTGAIGNVYWGDQSIRERLGEPLAVSGTTQAQVQGFQRGNMFYRADVDMIYVLASSGSWNRVVNAATSFPEATQVDDGLWEPGGLLGYHWREFSWIADEVGYATSAAAAQFTATVQVFEHGVIMVGVNSIYVLYEDASLTWEFYPNSQ